jgi:hypothetical protein
MKAGKETLGCAGSPRGGGATVHSAGGSQRPASRALPPWARGLPAGAGIGAEDSAGIAEGGR